MQSTYQAFTPRQRDIDCLCLEPVERHLFQVTLALGEQLFEIGAQCVGSGAEPGALVAWQRSHIPKSSGDFALAAEELETPRLQFGKIASGFEGTRCLLT
jgi:hypothetical protein